MIKRFDNWNWEDVPVRAYKDNPIGAQGVIRQNLSEGVDGDFELRYFEVEPGGYSSHEQHEHSHLVIVVRGAGKVLLGEAWHDVRSFDLVHVPRLTPHQFVATGTEPLGFLCVVDRVRDRPVLLSDHEGAVHASN